MNYLAFVIPAFVFLVVLEYYYSIKKQKKLFQFSETVSNINVGIFERICDLFTTTLFHFFFVWLYQNFAIFSIQSSILSWVVLFLITDLLWYWYHRLGHKVNILWAAHIVHHQSEDFNFTVAARITFFQAVFRSLFWAIIPILGFRPEMITLVLLLHGAYPFFLHTQTIGNLGWYEKLFVTPSHHRVHHSSDEKYIDKNFGDVLIVWDKLFGTFVAEDTKLKINYGICHPIKSYSFLWQHFHYLLAILVVLKRAKGFKNKWLAFFGKPEHFDSTISKELEYKLLTHSNSENLSPILIKYTTINLVFNLSFVFFFLLFGYYFSPLQLVLGALFVFFSLIHSGAILEQKKWLFYTEFIRANVLLIFFLCLFPAISFTAPLLVILLLTALFYYKKLNDTYLRLLIINH
jgi:alkylglycerol monooxygenase